MKAMKDMKAMKTTKAMQAMKVKAMKASIDTIAKTTTKAMKAMKAMKALKTTKAMKAKKTTIDESIDNEKQQQDKPKQSSHTQWIPAWQSGKQGGDWTICGFTIHWVNTRARGTLEDEE